MNHPWLTTTDWPVTALDGKAARKTATSATSCTVVNSPSTHQPHPGGVTERYHRIRWILAHAGGFLPFVAWRLALADELPEYGVRVSQGVLTHIQRFYYETALSPSPYAMASLRELVDPGQIVSGSDFPFAPEAIVANEVATLRGLTVFDEGAKQGINRRHAIELFPRFASALRDEAAITRTATAATELGRS